VSTPLIGILSVIIVVLDVVNGIAKGWKKVKPSGCDFERELAAQKVVINLMVDKGSAFYMSFQYPYSGFKPSGALHQILTQRK
jgi:hypothetical protein